MQKPGESRFLGGWGTEVIKFALLGGILAVTLAPAAMAQENLAPGATAKIAEEGLRYRFPRSDQKIIHVVGLLLEEDRAEGLMMEERTKLRGEA